MLKWFRPGLPTHQTALAMIGAKAGDRVLVMGHVNAGLAAEVARVTGLNGRTLVLGPPLTKAAVDAAAARAGTLVEFTEHGTPSFDEPADIVVLGATFAGLAGAERSARLRQAFEHVRPGGRLVTIDTGPRGGFLSGPKTPAPAPADVLADLSRAGAVAARVLAEADGVTYFEARRAR